MKTLVTGGNGLVGSAIESDFKPTRKGLDLMNIDDIIRYITMNEIDSVVHCAAKVGGIKANSEHLGEFYYKNIIINTNVLEAARKTGINKVVSFMSTCVFPDDVVYPLTPCQMHLGEPHPSNYSYAYAKRMLEVQSRAYREEYGCNFVTVIPCNIYGPNDNFSLEDGHVIPSLIHKCWEACEHQQDFEIWGTGKALREFIYSKDIGKITQWVLENYDSPEPLIISPDEEISIKEIVKEIADIFEFGGEIVFDGRRDGQLRKPSNNMSLKYILNEFLPDFKFTTIREGLEKSIKWFCENHNKETIRL